MTASALRLSPQQESVLDWVANGEGNALLTAVAGSGKTTTLIEVLARVTGTAALCAYNKKIADEISAKLAQRGLPGKAATFHSFGFAAWRKTNKNVNVDSKKIYNLLDEAFDIHKKYHAFVAKAVSLAKQSGIGIYCAIDDLDEWDTLVEHFGLDELLYSDAGNGDPNAAVNYAIGILQKSNALGDSIIDFDDQIYLPLLYGSKFDVYNWVLVDEAQDSNWSRRELAKRILAPNGRLIAVGDPAQAIYGFTGADSDSLDIIRKNFNAIDLPLTVSFRCPREVVAVAQQYVSHIQAADSAEDGIYRVIEEDEFLTYGKAELDATSAVLCRNTAPLLELAYSLIARGIPCHVEGRDIGTGLLKLARRWSRVYDLQAWLLKLDDWAQVEIINLQNKKRETQAESVQDRVDCIHIIAERCDTREDLYEAINSLFEDVQPGQAPRNLTLSTIHKSKGREWPRVYWLGANRYQPSKYAKQLWQIQQEVNLLYVAATRAQHELVTVNVPIPVKSR